MDSTSTLGGVKAVIVRARGLVVVEDVSVEAELPDGFALVKVEHAGICGTDLKIIDGAISVAHPRVLGHEIVGRVVSAGNGATPKGTRVLVDPYVACGTCSTCLRDLPHLCPTGQLLGRDVDGGMAEYVGVSLSQLHPLPERLLPAEVSLLQVLGTCVHAQSCVSSSAIRRPAAVIGLGVSGLLHAQLLALRGFEVIGITRSAAKRDLARELGVAATAHPDDAPALVDEVTGGSGVDLVVETAGATAALQQAIEIAGRAGKLIVFGIPGAGDGLDLYDLYFKELHLISPRAARPRDYRTAIELAATQSLQLAPLWSGSFPLADAPAAFDRLRESDALKLTLEVA